MPTGSSSRTLWALAAANARYWPTVAPEVQRELQRWEAPAAAISDQRLRALALGKLQEERFNAEVAATVATLAARKHRTAVTRSIVALELLFDYLDGRTEQLAVDPLEQAQRLFQPFVAAVAVNDDAGPATSQPEQPADGQYLTALSARTRSIFRSLPGAAVVAATATASATQCAEGQARIHASASTGEGQIEQWARENAAGSGLEWREYLAGCASSVLAVHALIAAAADPVTSEADARTIDAAYLAIGAVITILDSVVDATDDEAEGRCGFVALYEPGELPERIATLTHEALARAQEAPHAAHHAMTLAGVGAYYTTHPGARRPEAREVVEVVRRGLAPTIWPAVGVMRCWRAAKQARAGVRDRGRTTAINCGHGERP